MGSTFLVLLLAVAIQGAENLTSEEGGFVPKAIPLSYWDEDRESRSVNTAAPVVSLPAHYWEDALRHSVYLTLVRDKIDNLIAKGEVLTPNAIPQQNKEIDDHDLWDKIKNAPFDRVKEDEPVTDDVSLMAKGRLVEAGSGYRFAEDNRNEQKCSNSSCNDIKAYWSVKRVKQRDGNQGRYHYELTFSVNTQIPKQEKKKPYENPVRTFTVRETVPETIVDRPQEYKIRDARKVQKTIWFHKNIVPVQRHHGRQYQNGLDRLFSSLFDDDEPRPKPTPSHQQHYTQYSKVGYVNTPSESSQKQKVAPYPYKQPTVKYTRPMSWSQHQPQHPPPHTPPQPPQQINHGPHYLDTDSIGVVSNHDMPPYPPDHRYVPQGPNGNNYNNKQRPFKQPPNTASSPPPNSANTTGFGNETVTTYRPEKNEITTGISDIITGFHKTRAPVKYNRYYPEHVRPPVYNAPPGVFVTMDKKPFKPLPPLRSYHSKPIKLVKPPDFRPSPQLYDTTQFSEPDPSLDSIFRPINLPKYTLNVTSTSEGAEFAESTKPKENIRKWNATEAKPTKKLENKKAPHFATAAPEIITAHSVYSEDDSLQWANLLGAFSKTTPMGHKEHSKDTDSTTPLSTTSTTSSTTPRATTRTTTTSEAPSTTTTPAPPKRTRPPHVFEVPNPVKVKKHKRRTTTTTEIPEKSTKYIDLTPQASNRPKKWKPSSTSQPSTESQTEAPSSSSTARYTTTQKPTTTTTTTTTTAQPTTTTEAYGNHHTTEYSKKAQQIKKENRYRQSTLMYKGTSVKHDKWSAANVANVAETVTKTKAIPAPGNFPRRKGSNFIGYVKTTTPKFSEYDEDYKEDTLASKISITSENPSTKIEKQEISKTTQSSKYEEVVEEPGNQKYESQALVSHREEKEEEEDDEAEPDNDNSLEVTKTYDTSELTQEPSSSPSEQTNEIVEEDSIAEQTVTESLSSAKNKTKCKKKKQGTPAPTEPLSDVELKDDELIPTSSTTQSTSTKDIFDDLFGGFTAEDVTDSTETEDTSSESAEIKGEGSENHDRLFKVNDEEFEDFLDDLDDKQVGSKSEEFYSDEEREAKEYVPSFDSEDEEEPRQNREESYDELESRSPYSLFELMAMD